MVGGVSTIHLAFSSFEHAESVIQCKVVLGPSLHAVRCHKYNRNEWHDPIFKNVEIIMLVRVCADREMIISIFIRG